MKTIRCLAAAAAVAAILAACSDSANTESSSGEVPAEIAAYVADVTAAGDTLEPLGGRAPEDDPAVGTPAPALTGVSYDGTPASVADSSDVPTMLVFGAHWCPHCNNELPTIIKMSQDGLLPDDLRVVLVSTSPNATGPNFPPDEWLETMGWPFEVIVDGVDLEHSSFVASQAYGVDGFPFITLIDADGNVAARWAGAHGAATISAAVDNYLG